MTHRLFLRRFVLVFALVEAAMLGFAFWRGFAR
jgi:hypothetical protein